jgi:hypothetical protein
MDWDLRFRYSKGFPRTSDPHKTDIGTHIHSLRIDQLLPTSDCNSDSMLET